MNVQETTNFVVENQGTIVTVLGVLCTHFLASITVAVTKTKNNAWYKLVEALALTVLKAKDKAGL